MGKLALLFDRNLRVKDNGIWDGLHAGDQVLPVFHFQPTWIQRFSPIDFPRWGPQKLRFLKESLVELDRRFHPLGLQLSTIKGDVGQLIQHLQSLGVRCIQLETPLAPEEQYRTRALVDAGFEVRTVQGNSMYPEFSDDFAKDSFSNFKKHIEKQLTKKGLSITPRNPSSVPELSGLPTRRDLPLEVAANSETSELPKMAGGEGEAELRLRHYFFNSKAVDHYKRTRNGMLQLDDSSKFSAYLAWGCMSVAGTTRKLRDYESQHGSNSSTYWLWYELLWREFFRWQFKKHGRRFFQDTGLQDNPPQDIAPDARQRFQCWCDGKTENDFIDATMIELNTTGFMSNRGRQNAASYLIHDLGVPWLWGAEYFESRLIDYDVSSNYGNWAYIAGVGSRKASEVGFDVEQQAESYDPDRRYRQRWLGGRRGKN